MPPLTKRKHGSTAVPPVLPHHAASSCRHKQSANTAALPSCQRCRTMLPPHAAINKAQPRQHCRLVSVAAPCCLLMLPLTKRNQGSTAVLSALPHHAASSCCH
ncbi:hypothetical protein COO60DRAFT_1284492 [Scenedesmus sp. NREL 46B-D3]|nr:hypothetical protein COO60DRAFT_1284492 [Scenedesmus sp. NREL 46B-D3]